MAALPDARPPNVTLRQLRVLLAIAGEGGFSRAGEQIGLSQPAVSQCLRALEGELGARLLDRTTREVVLTPAGEALAAPLTRVLGELDDLLRQTRELGDQARGVVRVASAPTVSAGLMPRCLSQAVRRYPDVQVLLQDRPQSLVLEALRGGAVDFAVVIGGDGLDDLEQVPVLEESFVLVCDARHALAGRARARFTDLAGQPLVLLDHSSGSRPLIDDALHARGVVPARLIDVGNPTTAFRMVAEGLGVSILPALALPLPDARNLRALPLSPALRRRVVLVRRRNRSLSAAARAVWNLIAEVAGSPAR
ncbi:MAG: LysR family transcriptional regulator [Burkholderiales bacterium]|nr:LysR family transcriptional regulator [Burkholderiales bacterium]